MSNFDPSFYPPNIYMNTYSLWENSAYYDINNLSPQNFSSSWHRSDGDDYERYPSCPAEGEAPEPPDHRNRENVDKEPLYEDPKLFFQNDNWHHGSSEDFHTRYTSRPTKSEALEAADYRNRRIVTRESLYEDPNLLNKNDEEEESTPTTINYWPHVPWHRPIEEAEEGPSSKCNGKMVRSNKSQKKMDKMLGKSVKMSKAESMMQKMGWDGGALGRTGSGIMEPLAPSTVYGTGFGQPLEPIAINVETREHFTTNVLYHIYEFVKNNAETELLFDRKLSKEERKRVHYIVELLLNVDEMTQMCLDTVSQMEIVLQICDVNCYVLTTQSEGVFPDRYTCIYKEAPLHVYLLIPDDLRDDSSEAPSLEPTDPNPEVSDNEAEEETNPFLKSITRNLKKTKEAEKTQKQVVEGPPKETIIFKKILEYFSDFAGQRRYGQFKFLGPFSEEELLAIRQFLEKAALHLSGEDCETDEVFNKITFEITEDITGNTVINKLPKY